MINCKTAETPSTQPEVVHRNMLLYPTILCYLGNIDWTYILAFVG